MRRRMIIAVPLLAGIAAFSLQAAELAGPAAAPSTLASANGSATNNSAMNSSATDEIVARRPIRLSLRRAVQLATSPEGSVRVQLDEENLKQAKDRSNEVRAGLLPDVESYVSAQTSVRSLAAQGLSGVHLGVPASLSAGLEGILGAQLGGALANVFQEAINGFSFPSRAGPYDLLDARGTGQQVVFDFGLIRRVQASHATVRSAKHQLSATDEQVASQVAKSYLAALRADAQVDAVQADLDLSEATVKSAEHQKEAGSGTGLDVTRAGVQAANDKQRLLVAKNEQSRAHYQLLRTMSMRLDTAVELTDTLDYKPTETLTVEDAISQALANRPDLKAQLEREDAAKLNSSSVKYERLPSVVTQFDYGTIGGPAATLVPTRDFIGSVRIPVFDGGRRDARRAEAASQLRQERLRTQDIRDQIEMDVRTAMDSLKSAEEQVKVAEEGLSLAEHELAQTRRRFEAGVSGSLEVSDSSDRLQRARTNRINALYNYRTARIDLAWAMGRTADMID